METIKTLKENVEIILPTDGLEEKLKLAKAEKRSLVIKLGFDPTAPDLHLGHAVVLKKIRQFQDLGHQVVILVGSFTARIGDPTGKNKSRKPLSIEEIQHNAQTYINQLDKVIDVSKAEIVYNSDWLDSLNFSEIISLLSKVTLAQLMQRHDFNKRYTDNTPISMHELVYPILQGYDSTVIQCDIEMGGTDQLFNCTMGRQLQETMGMKPQIVMCMPLLRGLDGKEKMSKSLNNIIGLTDSPNEMFGKTMSIPDHLIQEYIDLTTDFDEVSKLELSDRLDKGENPMEIKKMIAKNIIGQYHDQKAAVRAELFFENQFQNKNDKEKSFISIAMHSLGVDTAHIKLVDLCYKIKDTESKSFVRRLIESGAVQIDHEKEIDPDKIISIHEGVKVKIGKRGFYELVS